MIANIIMWLFIVFIVAPMFFVSILSIIVCLTAKKLRGEEDDGESEKSDNESSV